MLSSPHEIRTGGVVPSVCIRMVGLQAVDLQKRTRTVQCERIRPDYYRYGFVMKPSQWEARRARYVSMDSIAGPNRQDAESLFAAREVKQVQYFHLPRPSQSQFANPQGNKKHFVWRYRYQFSSNRDMLAPCQCATCLQLDKASLTGKRYCKSLILLLLLFKL
jgi:hypothetical protein